MKKLICIVLSIVFTLTLCSCSNNGHEIPFEECAQYALGTWVDPLDNYDDIVLNRDNTSTIMGENLTWEVSYSNADSPDLEYDSDWFIVDFYDGDTLKYDVTFDYVKDPGLWVSTGSRAYDKEGNSSDLEEGLAYYYRFRPEDVDIIKITPDNWIDYFSAVQIFEWEDTTDEDDWSLHEYIVLNPEIVDRAVETNYRFGVLVEFFFQPYHYTIDKEEFDIVLGKPYYEGEIDTLVEEIYYTINKADYKYKEGDLTLESIFLTKNILSPEHVYVAEYLIPYDAFGTLILAK